LLLVFTIVLAFRIPHAVGQVSFTPLGYLPDAPGPGFRSEAIGISGDASVVVGWSSSNLLGGEAFRWTRDSGMVGLGSLPAIIPGSRAAAASNDGSVIAGSSHFGAFGQAFRWTAETGMVALGTLSGDIQTSGSAANSISADGNVVVGYGENEGTQEAFRWTAAEGMRPLAERTPLFLFSRAHDVSADGSVIVGTIQDIGSVQRGFRWSSPNGLVRIAGLGSASAVSADGSIIVGRAGGVAARWTEAGGIIELGDLPGGDRISSPSDLSADGSVVVGTGQTEIGSEAMIWTAETGMVNLRQALLSLGISELTDWTLISAAGVSADGRTIVGTGINPAGLREAYVATIPEPSTMALAALAATSLLALGMRRLLRNCSQNTSPPIQGENHV
jgi:probable HAF family extracellular repeat protein